MATSRTNRGPPASESDPLLGRDSPTSYDAAVQKALEVLMELVRGGNSQQRELLPESLPVVVVAAATPAAASMVHHASKQHSVIGRSNVVSGHKSESKPTTSQVKTRPVVGESTMDKPVMSRTSTGAANVRVVSRPTTTTTTVPPATTTTSQDMTTTTTTTNGEIPADIIADLNNSSAPWKKRDDALAHIESYVKSVERIPARSQRELAIGLGKRLDDTQRNIAARAAMVIGILAQSVGGTACTTLIKATFGERLIMSLGDTKKNVAMAAHTALTACAVHQEMVHSGAFASIIQISATCLKSPKNVDRGRLLDWIINLCDKCDVHDDALRLSLHDLVEPLLSCLQARDGPTRHAAVRLITICVERMHPGMGAQRFRAGLRDLKTAESRVVTPVVEDILAKVASAAAASTAAISKPAEDNGIGRISQSSMAMSHISLEAMRVAELATAALQREEDEAIKHQQDTMEWKQESSSSSMSRLLPPPHDVSTPPSEILLDDSQTWQESIHGFPTPAVIDRHALSAMLEPLTPPRMTPPLQTHQTSSFDSPRCSSVSTETGRARVPSPQRLSSPSSQQRQSLSSSSSQQRVSPRSPTLEERRTTIIKTLQSIPTDLSTLSHSLKSSQSPREGKAKNDALAMARVEKGLEFVIQRVGGDERASSWPWDEFEWRRVVEEELDVGKILDGICEVISLSASSNNTASLQLSRVCRVALQTVVCLARIDSLRAQLDAAIVNKCVFIFAMSWRSADASSQQGRRHADYAWKALMSLRDTPSWLNVVLDLPDHEAASLASRIYCKEHMERVTRGNDTLENWSASMDDMAECLTKAKARKVESGGKTVDFDFVVDVLEKAMLGQSGHLVAVAAAATPSPPPSTTSSRVVMVFPPITKPSTPKTPEENKNSRLAGEIFARVAKAMDVGDHDECRTAIVELHAFHAKTGVDLRPLLASKSSLFRAYLEARFQELDEFAPSTTTTTTTTTTAALRVRLDRLKMSSDTGTVPESLLAIRAKMRNLS